MYTTWVYTTVYTIPGTPPRYTVLAVYSMPGAVTGVVPNMATGLHGPKTLLVSMARKSDSLAGHTSTAS